MSAFEEMLNDIGTFGPYQIRVFVLVSAFETPAAWAMLLPVFAGAKPTWICPEQNISLYYDNDNSSATNSTSNWCGPQGEICTGLEYTSDFTSVVTEVRGLFNSLRPSDAIWRHYRSLSTLAQVMACCLAAPSHFLNQCWFIIGGVLPRAISYELLKNQIHEVSS